MSKRNPKSKASILRTTILERGYLSNTDVLSGFPTRTNRLAKYIHIFRSEGMKIETKIMHLTDGDYLDTIYSLVSDEDEKKE